MRALWGPPTSEAELQAYHAGTLIYPVVTVAPDEEYAFLPNLNFETVLKVVELRAGGPAGRIYIHNDRVEAEPQKPVLPEGLSETFFKTNANRKISNVKDMYDALLASRQAEETERKRAQKEHERLVEEACAHSGPAQASSRSSRQRLADFAPRKDRHGRL